MNRTRIKSKKKIVMTVLLVLMVAVIGVVLGTRLLRRQVESRFAGGNAQEISTAAVTKGSISTSAAGTGTLEDDDVETVQIPKAVEVKQVHAVRGKTVEENAVLATVNTPSVISAMSDVQSQLDTLDKQLQSATNETVRSSITAKLAGRVKAVYVDKDADVASVMYDKNALMLLSLDGYMAVEFENDSLTGEDTVKIVCSDGTEKEGTVSEARDGLVTVLVTDNGPKLDEEVQIVDSDGNELGRGNLVIHKELKVTGFAGTVSTVPVSENQKVSVGQTLLTLKDTNYTANFDSLLKQRADLEEQLVTLVQIYRDGAIIAPVSGTVGDITYDPETDEGTAAEERPLLSIRPDATMTLNVEIDESDILALEVGQKVKVTVNSIKDESFEGTLTELGTTGTSSGGVTSYTAKISVPKAPGMLAGMSASAAIQIQGVEEALLIPTEALHKTSSTAFVYTGYDEEAKKFTGMVEVQIGISNGKFVEITSGLKVGDTVYYSPRQDAPYGFPMYGNNRGGNFNMPGRNPGNMTGRSSGGNGNRTSRNRGQ